MPSFIVRMLISVAAAVHVFLVRYSQLVRNQVPFVEQCDGSLPSFRNDRCCHFDADGSESRSSMI